jgi:hypothetical protein
VDNHLQLGEPCSGEVSIACAYSSFACPPVITSGVAQDLLCEIDEIPVEICDGFDNDCDGVVDNLDGDEEVCDGLDNDCNGEIDEGNVCASLIYRQCSASLGWAYITEEVPAAPWALFPPVLPADVNTPACTMFSNLNEPTYSCDTAYFNSGFRVMDIGTESVRDDHWLAIAWDCSTDPGPFQPLTASEEATINWARDRCYIALGYRDNGNADGVSDLSPGTCPALSASGEQFTPRCVKTTTPGSYSGIELEGRVNGDDQFGIAFYCEAQAGDEARWSQVATSIRDNFQIFLGNYLGYNGGNPKLDGIFQWTDLPNQSVDRLGKTRGVGSALGEARFNVFDTRNNNFDEYTQFSIYTHLP